MFKPDDYKISMEKELRLRMFNDEINHCDNVEELRMHLINATRLFTQKEHLLEIAIQKLIIQDIETMMYQSDKIEVTKE